MTNVEIPMTNETQNPNSETSIPPCDNSADAHDEPDPWDAILSDPSPRPELARWIEEVEREIAEGKTTPLDFERL